MPSWESTIRRHGTHSGWSLHRDLKEQPCDACCAAKAEYDRNRKKAPYHALMNRLHSTAQMMANSQLKHNHPEEYKALYDANKAQLLVERAEELEYAKAIKPVA